MKPYQYRIKLKFPANGFTATSALPGVRILVATVISGLSFVRAGRVTRLKFRHQQRVPEHTTSPSAQRRSSSAPISLTELIPPCDHVAA